MRPDGCVAKLEIMKDASIIPPALWSYEDMREIPTPRTTPHLLQNSQEQRKRIQNTIEKQHPYRCKFTWRRNKETPKIITLPDFPSDKLLTRDARKLRGVERLLHPMEAASRGLFENEKFVYGCFQCFGHVVRQLQRGVVFALLHVDYSLPPHADLSRQRARFILSY